MIARNVADHKAYEISSGVQAVFIALDHALGQIVVFTADDPVPDQKDSDVLEVLIEPFGRRDVLDDRGFAFRLEGVARFDDFLEEGFPQVGHEGLHDT